VAGTTEGPLQARFFSGDTAYRRGRIAAVWNTCHAIATRPPYALRLPPGWGRQGHSNSGWNLCHAISSDLLIKQEVNLLIDGLRQRHGHIDLAGSSSAISCTSYIHLPARVFAL
jgi:hypothetical protein